MKIKPMGFLQIDLNGTNNNDFIEANKTLLYFCKINGYYYSGTFSKQWYGLNFNNWGTSGIQLEFIEEVYLITFGEEIKND